ncbi:MAG: cytochrome c biogenesis heme-transporting ATPase CcmA [Casimicrobiaceae bacterium]
MPIPAILTAHELAARRGATLLWRDVSFALHGGDALVVTGANGAGKTTLLRVLAGLTQAEHGTLDWRGGRMHPFAPALRADLLFCGHAPALKDALSASENVQSLASLAAEDASAATVSAALGAVGLAAHAALPARVLSQGQRRRVHLALLALSTRPLWILDEPATALDAQGLAWLQATLAAHCAAGGIVVLATHAPIAITGAQLREIAL